MSYRTSWITIYYGTIYPGTLLGRVINAGYSPVDILFECGEGSRRAPTVTSTDGIVDSLRFLLHSPGYKQLDLCETSLLSLKLKILTDITIRFKKNQTFSQSAQ
jgi:hypothetical protein